MTVLSKWPQRLLDATSALTDSFAPPLDPMLTTASSYILSRVTSIGKFMESIDYIQKN